MWITGKYSLNTTIARNENNNKKCINKWKKKTMFKIQIFNNCITTKFVYLSEISPAHESKQ